MKGLLLRLALVLGVLGAYYATRAPFLTQPLLGEEGMFADLLAHSPQGPRYALMARIQGQEVRDIYQHPALMYEAYTRLGQLMWAKAGPSDVWARVLHTLFQALLWCFLAWHAARAKGKAGLVLLALLAVALSAPLGLSSSIHLQTDNSTGILLAGLLGLSLAGASAEDERSWLAPALACLALSAVGKQEWFIGATAGLIGAEILGALVWGPDKRVLRFTAYCLGALALGQVISWAFDPLNYVGGWGVLARLGSHNVAGQGQQAVWGQVWVFRLIFLSGLVLLLLTSLGMALSAGTARRRIELRAAMVAWALFVPFALSTWNPSPRYFAPAWGAVLGALTLQVTLRDWRWPLALALLALGGLLALWQQRIVSQMRDAHVSVTESILYDYRLAAGRDEYVAFHAKGCVPRLSTGYAWNRSSDFVGDGLAYEDGQKLLAEHGLKLCPPPPSPKK